MKEARFSFPDLLSSDSDQTRVLLEYYAAFSKRIHGCKDFKSMVCQVHEELRQIYPDTKIEIILHHNKRRLVRFSRDPLKNRISVARDFTSDNTIYHYVANKRKVVLTNNYAALCEQLGLEPAGIESVSWLGVPMDVRQKVLGVLVMRRMEGQRLFRLHDKQFLSAVADIVSIAMENIYLYDYILERQEQSARPPAISTNGTPQNTMKGALKRILLQSIQDSGAHASAILLRPIDKNIWRRLSGQSTAAPDLLAAGNITPFLTSLSNEQLAAGNPIRFDLNSRKMTDDFRQTLLKAGIRSGCIHPFKVNASYFGAWVTVFSNPLKKLGEDEVKANQFTHYLISQIIERKALTERKNRYDTYLKHLDRMKLMGELASGTAHSINNILSVIIGKGQLLQHRLSGTPYHRDIALVLKAADDGANSIRRLQELSTNQQVPFDMVAVDVNHLICEVVEIARPRFEDEAQCRGIHYSVRIVPGKIHPVSADPSQLREVLLNLINNALDAMPRGGKLILKTSVKDSNVLILVSDTGIGIPPEICDKIFEPFYTTKGKYGNGLGLSIAADIIRSHNGKIYVDSVPQKGSVFMIELPITAKRQLPASLESFQPQSMAHSILLVEDEALVRETLTEVLEAAGCRVTAVSSAAEAIEAFGLGRFDVVFADLSMPNINGIALSRQLKQHNPRIPVFLITGWNQVDPAFLSSNDVIDGIIRKPLNMSEVKRDLARVLEHYHKVNRNGQPA